MEPGHPEISVRRQCELLGVNRSGLYYEPVGESEENLRLMRLLDEQYTRTPFYGSRRMTAWLGEPRARGEPQAGSAADGGDGDRGGLSEAEAEPAGRRAQDLPVPAARAWK